MIKWFSGAYVFLRSQWVPVKVAKDDRNHFTRLDFDAFWLLRAWMGLWLSHSSLFTIRGENLDEKVNQAIQA